MLYTLSGAVLGGLFTYMFCKLFNIETSEKSTSIIRFPSSGQILICIGAIFGAGVGFGVGTYKLTHGGYLP